MVCKDHAFGDNCGVPLLEGNDAGDNCGTPLLEGVDVGDKCGMPLLEGVDAGDKCGMPLLEGVVAGDKCRTPRASFSLLENPPNGAEKQFDGLLHSWARSQFCAHGDSMSLLLYLGTIPRYQHFICKYFSV